MTEEAKQKLIAAGRQDLIDACELNESGYAGINRNGTIVDRRLFPDAIPVQANAMFNVPEPKPINTPPMSNDNTGPYKVVSVARAYATEHYVCNGDKVQPAFTYNLQHAQMDCDELNAAWEAGYRAGEADRLKKDRS